MHVIMNRTYNTYIVRNSKVHVLQQVIYTQ